MKIIKDNLSELEIRQMNTINELQEKINLMEFDISQLKKEKLGLKKERHFLRENIIDKNQHIKIIIKELETVRKEKNYKKISNILIMLNSISGDRQ